MTKKDYSEFEEACKVEHKSSVLRDMWNENQKMMNHIGIMTDDGMNKGSNSVLLVYSCILVMLQCSGLVDEVYIIWILNFRTPYKDM